MLADTDTKALRRIRVLAALIVLVGVGCGVLALKNHFAVKKVLVVQNQPIPDRPIFVPTVVTEDAKPVTPVVVGDFVLHIEKINVTVPIVTNVDGLDEKVYLKALEGGVAHYKGTPVPGKKGNSFIFGHSSYYANKPGSYKEIFMELGSLKKGDTFTVVHNNKDTYTYSVFVSKLTADDDGSVLDESKDEIMTLSTCWPPGTFVKRWIVQAKRVVDTPAKKT